MVPMVARSARTGESVAVAVADIDGFKSVNDIHGHDVGDEVIAHVAGELTGHVGDLGVVARSGGEEFTIALIHPSVDLLCDRFQATVEVRSLVEEEVHFPLPKPLRHLNPS